jgi:hypothetical protein
VPVAPVQVVYDLGRNSDHVRQQAHEQRQKIKEARVSRRISLRFDIRAHLPRCYRAGVVKHAINLPRTYLLIRITEPEG